MATYLWVVADAIGRGKEGKRSPHLFILPADEAEHWRARTAVLSCKTWGEVRALGPGIYEEVLGLAGYGDYDDYIAHFAIGGTAPEISPTMEGEATHALRSAEGPPADETPFHARDDLPACGDGDWPPSIYYLMYECHDVTVLKEYADVWETSFNGTYAAIPAQHKEAVFAHLAENPDDVDDDIDIEEAPWLVELLVPPGTTSW